MDYNRLKQELVEDPEGFGYLQLLEAGAHNTIEEVINTKQFTTVGRVGIESVLIWLAKFGIMPRLRSAANSANASVASIAEIALLLVQNPNIPSIDLGNEDVATLFGVLVDAGVITAEEQSELFGRSYVSKSRAEMIGLNYVSNSDIAAVAQEVLND